MQPNAETFVLCSTNRAKEKAVRDFLKNYHKKVINLVCIESESGVSHTPMSDEEGIQGAIQRIASAKEHHNSASTYIGLEGIITKNKFGTFVCGWAVIMLADGSLHMGGSAKVRLPDEIAGKASNMSELSSLTAQVYPERAELLPSIGTNGIITNGLYTRVDEFTDALKCAFGSLESQ